MTLGLAEAVDRLRLRVRERSTDRPPTRSATDLEPSTNATAPAGEIEYWIDPIASYSELASDVALAEAWAQTRGTRAAPAARSMPHPL